MLAQLTKQQKAKANKKYGELKQAFAAKLADKMAKKEKEMQAKYERDVEEDKARLTKLLTEKKLAHGNKAKAHLAEIRKTIDAETAKEEALLTATREEVKKKRIEAEKTGKEIEKDMAHRQKARDQQSEKLYKKIEKYPGKKNPSASTLLLFLGQKNHEKTATK